MQCYPYCRCRIEALVNSIINARLNIANGVAGLDGSGLIPGALLPAGQGGGAFLGSYASLAAAQAAHPTGQTGEYFYDQETGTPWFWNSAMNPPGWTNAEISVSDFNALTDAQKAGQRWLIIP